MPIFKSISTIFASQHSSMKALHICKVYFPKPGGIQRIVQKIVTRVGNFEQRVLTTQTGAVEKKTGIDTVRSFGEIRSLPIAPMLIPVLWKKMSQVDLLCVHYPFPLADIGVSLYPFRRPKIVVYWHSEIVSQRILRYLVDPFSKRMLTIADKIIVASPPVLEHSRLLKIHKDKTMVIPFGIDPAINKAETKNYFLAVGRHVPYKGYQILIHALENTDYTLKIVGDGPLIQSHMALARKLGLSEQIEFITDANDQQVQQHMQECYALVFPSTMVSEAFGLVQIEAMRFAKPIINTNLQSGVPWIARDKQEAITVTPGKVKELRNAMNELANNQELYAALSGSALNRFHQLFSTDIFLEKTRECYGQLMEEVSLPEK